MKKRILFFVGWLVLGFSSFGQWTVNTVPDPKVTGTGFVSNPDYILISSEVAFIDSIIQEVQDFSKAQIAVVMLRSIGSEVPKTFATELFNKWGVGNAETDNGLLILFVLDQRRIEFETGYGTEQILPDSKCYDIQQEYMVPHFKLSNYGQGIIDGVQVVVNIFMGRAQEISPGNSGNDAYNFAGNEESETMGQNNEWFFVYLKMTAFLFVLFLILLSILVFIRDHFVRYQMLRVFRLYFWFIFFPVPFIGVYYITKYFTEKWRNTPRISARTQKIMHKLSESEDDQYLVKGQIAEENVKSVDYDVWVSGEEGDVLIQSYKRWFSKYNACPKCKFKTYYKDYDKVISSPTYSSSGTGERHYKCTNCGHYKTVRYTIPRKTKTSSSSSGSSSWSSGGSSSWGGGSSGGGGAGSSW